MEFLTRRPMMTTFLAALALCTGVTVAQHDHGKAQPAATKPATRSGDPYPFDSCPISGKKLGSMGDAVVRLYDGREIRYCCGGCPAKFEKDLTGSLAAIDDRVIEDQAPRYPSKTSVVTGAELSEHATQFAFGNRLIRVDSDEEKARFLAHPGRFLRALDDAVVAAQGGNYPLVACPVSGERFDETSGEPVDLIVAGRLIRVGCDDCVDDVEKDPARFIALIDAASTASQDPATAPPTQTLELRSGEVVIGRVIDIRGRTLTVEVGFPDPGTQTVALAELEPRSAYAVLAARIDPSVARAHLDLAVKSRELGLPAHAIAEAREASRRDPALAPTADKLIAELRVEIATELLRQAEADLADDRPGSARLAAENVLRDYGGTTSATGARELLKAIAARTDRPQHEATPKEIENAIAGSRRELARTAEDADAPAHGSMRDQRALERVVARLERVWEAVRDLTPKDGDATAIDRLSAVRADLRARLTGAYLSLGTISLERRALPDADEWCNKACELDPENHQLHRLHDLIIQAKIVSGWYY